ncbi:MAG: hypothetical protein K6E12_10460 [Saccharofermentans sp.]|nr:hypothetical protein [Saccharofermentans sp.]
MKRNNIIRSIIVVIAIVLYASMAMASETYLLDPRASTEGQEIKIDELDHELFHDEIEEIMRYEGIDYNEAENKFFNEGYNRVLEIMRDEDISYDEAKEKYFDEEKAREEEEKVREEKEWEHYEENLYREFRSEGMDDEEARREAAVITYMHRYDVTEEEAKKALGFEGTETTETTTEETTVESTTEATTETTTEATSNQQYSVDDWLAFLEGTWEGEFPYRTEDFDGNEVQGTIYGSNDFKKLVEMYIDNGIPVSIDAETGALVISSGEVNSTQFSGFTIIKIDENTIKVIFPDIYVPNEYTYTRTQ